jgi:hypothetical protein
MDPRRLAENPARGGLRRSRSPSEILPAPTQRMRRNEHVVLPPPAPLAYTITGRIDITRFFSYSYQQIAAAPFLPRDVVPITYNVALQELTRQRVATYRSMLEFQGDRNQLITYTLLILRLRTAFRRLVRRFILRACDKIPFGEVDPITLSPVQKPVTLYDMKNRCRHRFEASTLMTNIHNQLLHTSFGFPAPVQPRNPLTNIDLTVGQLTSIYAQLTTYGYCKWTFSGLRAYCFNLERFTKMFETPLRHAAVRSTVLVDTNDVAAEQLCAFIHVYTAHHGSLLNELELSVLQYAATQRPSDSYLMCWRRLYLVALWHGIATSPATTRLDDLETHVQRRALVILTRILTMNIKNYFSEIRPDYNRWAAEQSDDDDDDDDDDEDALFQFIAAYVHNNFEGIVAEEEVPDSPG